MTDHNELMRGLRVEMVVEPNDYFLMTSFDIRFVDPKLGTKLDHDVIFTIKECLRFGLNKSKYGECRKDIRIIDDTGISINLFYESLSKDAALNLVLEMCNYLLSLEKGETENEYVRLLQDNLDAAKEITKDYIEIITTEDKYVYSKEVI